MLPTKESAQNAAFTPISFAAKIMSSTGKSNALSSSTAAVACNRRRAAPPNRHKSHFNNHFRAHADTHAYKLWHICVCVGQLTSAQHAKKPVISSTKPEKSLKYDACLVLCVASVVLFSFYLPLWHILINSQLIYTNMLHLVSV